MRVASSSTYRSAYHVHDTPRSRGMLSRSRPGPTLACVPLAPPDGLLISDGLASFRPVTDSSLSGTEVHFDSSVDPSPAAMKYRPRLYIGFTTEVTALPDSV